MMKLFYTNKEIPNAAKQKPALKQKMQDFLATVTPRTGVKVKEYLQFGKEGNAQIKYLKDGDYHYIGEINAANKPHGRCIRIDTSGGYVHIGYY